MPMIDLGKEACIMPVWIVAVQWLSWSVLALLVALSLWSVATMLRCSRLLNKADGRPGEGDDALGHVSQWIESRQWQLFREWAAKGETLHAGTARVILQTASNEASRIDRAVKSYLSLERNRLEQGLTVLATLGSNAPFIGLFGTVLGIIQAFGALAAHQTNAADIMVGISEALVATAVGLFVAIPAVVAFNVFTRKLRAIIVKSEALKDHYISKIDKS
jgi:biopolymer transport protein ExbB